MTWNLERPGPSRADYLAMAGLGVMLCLVVALLAVASFRLGALEEKASLQEALVRQERQEAAKVREQTALALAGGEAAVRRAQAAQARFLELVKELEAPKPDPKRLFEIPTSRVKRGAANAVGREDTSPGGE